MLQPDYERFVSTTAAPFFEAGDAGPNARQNFFCARLVTDASMAARAAAWVDESPRRDATIVALVGAERVAYEGGAASLCADRTGRSATRLLMNPPSATLERAVGAEGPAQRLVVASFVGGERHMAVCTAQVQTLLFATLSVSAFAVAETVQSLTEYASVCASA